MDSGFTGWRKSTKSSRNGACVEVASWRTSSRSYANGSCVEVGSYRKSTRSIGNGSCVEVGQGAAVVGVRDSKLAGSPVLVFSAEAWRTFAAALR